VSGGVLGIDPGTAATGYGVVEPGTGRLGHLVECGVIRTDARAPLPQRLRTIYDGVTELIERHRPVALALESVFYAKNVRTTVTLGHARGVILLAAEQSGIRIAEFPPATVKKSIVGTGGAAKAQVGFMVQKLLKLAAPPTPDDAADGVALALTYLITGSDRP
jgi:crossover junction endodeoxyribonuclease RuvC